MLTPRKRRHPRKKLITGITLIELLLVAGVIIAGTSIILGVAFGTQAGAKRSEAQSEIHALVKNIQSSHGASANYSTLTTTSAAEEGLFPPGMLDSASGQAVTPWGGAINVAGISRDGGPEGSSFVISMENISSRDCTPLASSLSPGFTEIVVNEISVGGRNEMNIARLSEACTGRGSGNLVQLYHDNPHAHAALPDCTGGGVVETDTQACPGGMLGSISRQRIYTCPSMYSPPVAGPWVVVLDTCAPECVLPDPNPTTETRPGGSCPAGHTGEIIESRTTTYTCPAATGHPVAAHSEWVESSNTCEPECVASGPTTEDQILECPAGQAGAIIQERITTWSCQAGFPDPVGLTYPWETVSDTCAPICEAPDPETETMKDDCEPWQTGEITKERTITWSCPASATTPTRSEGPWVTTSDTCASSCVLPEENPEVETREGRCPIGQEGVIIEEQITTWYCYRDFGMNVPMPSVIPWREISNTCVQGRFCVPPESTRKEVTRPAEAERRNVGCASDEYGSHWQSREREEIGTETINWTCPLGAREPVSHKTTTWSDTYNWLGDWVTTENTCRRPVACVAPRPETETNPLSCPRGWGGSRWEERQRTFSCPDTYGDPVPSPWGPWREYDNCYEMCTNGDFEPIGMMERETSQGTYACSAPGRGTVFTDITTTRQPGRTCVNRRWVQPTSQVITRSEIVTGGTYRNPLCEDPSYWY